MEEERNEVSLMALFTCIVLLDFWACCFQSCNFNQLMSSKVISSGVASMTSSLVHRDVKVLMVAQINRLSHIVLLRGDQKPGLVSAQQRFQLADG